ncbi:sensor domain-containing diguanylate cyclase [Ferrimonas lipolytica]|uniref:diguanylate cyclase n=1 Tax=Ferrimonas lipolytica TaxID=2724191 RepID=A0A6H1UC12_9GAMM|nr:sensor domain-containing diguanylate cyclase [Ferrimonas lipolytica]QIZ76120.1 sensor domain-containing diguanylate cyclase [Ferrimonas lipolytica]
MFASQRQDRTASKQRLYCYLAATLLGCIGLLVNLFPIPLFANVHLILGNAAILIASARLGRGPLLWCMLLTVSGLYFSFGQPISYFLFGLEALFVNELRRRGQFLLYADLIYWTLLGMPLAYLLFSLSPYPNQYMLFSVVKQGFNGVLYTAIASVILMLMPKWWLQGVSDQEVVNRDFRDKLSYGVVILISLSLMVSLLLSSCYLIRTQQELLFQQMDSASVRVSDDLEQIINRYVDAIEIAGKWMPTETAVRQDAVAELHQQYQGFSSILVAKNDGSVVAATPRSYLDHSPQFAVRQYSYLANNFAIHKTQLTGAQYSGEDNGGYVVVATAPWFDPLGNADGVIEATINVQYLRSQLDLDGHLRLVITDSDDQVVIASKGLNIEPLSPLKISAQQPTDSAAVNLVKLNQHDDFFEQTTSLTQGWTLHVLTAYKPVIERAEQQFLIGLLILIVGSVVSTMLTRKLSRHLTKPLEMLTKQLALPYQAADSMRRLPLGSAREILLLHRELKYQRQSIAQYQEQLEDKVAKRTAELAAANTKLARLALRDGLTGVYNRRHFNDRFESYRQYSLRSDQPLLLAMIDVDHFKRVNDNHGHLVGDDCLKALAAVIQTHFSRENDLVVRYGGEEFLLLLPHMTIETAQLQLEQLRLAVQHRSLVTLADGMQLTVSVSIGAIIADAGLSNSYDDWVFIADQALYRAKNSGRNRLELEAHVDSAVKNSAKQAQTSALTTSLNELG